jgi:hypothetical protein
MFWPATGQWGMEPGQVAKLQCIGAHVRLPGRATSHEGSPFKVDWLLSEITHVLAHLGAGCQQGSR